MCIGLKHTQNEGEFDYIFSIAIYCKNEIAVESKCPKFDCEEVLEQHFQAEKKDVFEELWCTFSQSGLETYARWASSCGQQNLQKAFTYTRLRKDGGPGVPLLLCSFYHEPMRSLSVKEVQ